MRAPHAIIAITLACVVTMIGCAAESPRHNRFFDDINEFVIRDAHQAPPENAVLFIGSSSIRLWNTLHEDFPQYDVIQRGFGGSHFSDANLFVDRIVTPYQPAAIVVFEGTNDIASGKSADQVFRDYRKFVRLVRAGEQRPEPAPILFIGVTPTESRWEHWPEMSRLNELVKAHTARHEHLHYIDAPSAILETAPVAGGPPSRRLFVEDLLHLSPLGYDVWVDVITPDLEATCPPQY